MTRAELEKIIQNELNWLISEKERATLRCDIYIHIAEAVLQAYAKEDGTEAEHHEAGRFWNGSSGQYDDGGCW